MDYHRENGTVTFIYNVLNLKKDKAYYEAFPMTFIVEHRRLITISNTKNAYVIEQMTRYLESHDTLSIYKFLFASLKSSAMPIILSSSRWTRVRTRSMVSCVSEQLRKIFLRCPTWRLVLVYLTAAAKQNRMLLEHIQGHASIAVLTRLRESSLMMP